MWPTAALLAALWAHAGAADASLRARADADVLVITPKTDLKKLFSCSQLHPIGYYNEYFVTCALRDQPPPWRRIELQGVTIRGSDLYDDASASVHVELELVLNASAQAGTALELSKSALLASAVRLEASSVALDATSSVNTTACGLKFGPGYNSWFNMGSSYGGIGGAALASMLVKKKCEELPPNSFFRAVGSVGGDIGNFQGYGSGGGGDHVHGGGRIEIRALDKFVLNGSLIANGGAAALHSSDSAGSGGTVLVAAGHVGGSGTIQANGGEPAVFDEAKGSGGGGGGGGGRIAVSYKKLDELNATQLQAYGGGVQKKTASEQGSLQWCQLGADGTILKIQVGDSSSDLQRNSEHSPPLVASLVIKGRRVEHGVPAKPLQLFGCTALFIETSRGDPFVPAYVAQFFVTGGATVCVSYLVLQPIVSTTNSTIVVEPGSSVDTLDRNRTLTLGATHVSLQSYVGPASQSMRDAFYFLLDGDDVALANAQLLVDRVAVNAVSSLVVDKFSVVKFRSLASLAASSGDVQVLGFLQPDGEEEEGTVNYSKSYGDNPLVRATATQNILFKPQAAQIGAISIELHAGQDAEVDLPFETPFLVFFAEAYNLVVARVSGGSIRECKAVESLASPATCANLGKHSLTEAAAQFLVSLKATSTLTLGNVTAGSILACSDGVMSVYGQVTADGLGCSANSGPGASSIESGASGGAGHGGKGGNVEPGNTGGGKVYDIPSSEIWPQAPSGSTDGPTAWPVWPGSGAAAGDGSGGIAGGNGGGLVYIGARQLSFSEQPASISARGADGTKNGGGGAGGSVAIFVGEIVGNGVMDASGGDSLGPALLLNADRNGSLVWEPSWALVDANAGGGGGGGGIVRTFFRGDQPGTSGNADMFVKSGGKVATNGGKGAGGESGGVGVFAAVNCSVGRGGGLCAMCEPGAFSPGNQPRCLPCEPGSYADKAGLGACLKCAAGSFNKDFGQKTCEACAPGSCSTKEGATACAPCAPGSFADKAGTATCALCPNGTISVTAGATNCTVCGIGETTSKPGSLHCEQCRGKPDHAAYNVRGKCTYACEKGRTGLDCLTPFERFVKPIGGPLGFAILVISFVAVVFGSWAFLTFRTSADQKFRQRFAQYKAQTQRDEQSLTHLTKNLTPRLTDHDLTAHVTRLYFAGDNHLFSAWVLDPFGMPTELKELVRDEDVFASFANSCNELVAWPDSGGWECWVHRLLLMVLPPFATVFLRKRQLYRVERLAKHVTQYTGGFVRELSFRRHGSQLKVGFSPDFSLAFFDVIAPTTSNGLATTPSAARGRTPEKEPPKPTTSTRMTIAVAGSGSFFRPYHVDTNDALVRAVPARLELLQHQFWIDFIAEMNQQLRLVQQPSASRPRQERIATKLRELIAFVEEFNNKRRENADGIRVRFGTLESAAQFTELDSANLMTRLEAFPVEPFKFAILVTKPPSDHGATDSLSLRSSGPSLASTASSDANDAPQDNDDPRPFEFRYSSIRMEALFEQPSPVGSEDAQQPLQLNKLRRRDSRTATTVTDLLLCTPHSSTFHWLSAVLRPFAPLFRLRNLRPRAIKWPFLMPLTMLLLLTGDFIAMFWVLMEFYCVQVDDPTAHDSGCSRVAFVSVLSILPLAVPGAPLLGLISLTRKSVFYGKLFAVWTLGSIVNLAVAIICTAVYFNFVRESVLLVLAGWLVLKVLEKELALQCIAQYTVERPLRGWRGLHTTKDWYDAAYTPLIHHER